MKVEYISHASLLIETKDLKIATDPWFNGAAYCDQWHVFPRPVNVEALNRADFVLLSHGHEDHLHEPTLKLLPKTIKVLYPYSFFGGAKEFIESLGFADVREAVTYKSYQLSPHTSVTFLINSHDSIMVIESDGEVLVNANDALHSYPEKVIDFFIGEIKERWPKIDILLCGFGGASYFPNMMRLEGKNDWEMSIVREQLFAHNFCRVVAGLKPRVAVPFAADFALLADEERWINNARFPRAKMSRYYQRYFSDGGASPLIYDMYSGDVLEGEELKKMSPYHAQMSAGGGLEHLIDEQYSAEIVTRREQATLSEEEAEKLSDEIHRNAEQRMTLYQPVKLTSLKFCVEVTDVAGRNFYNVAVTDGRLRVWRTEAADEGSLLTMRLPSRILRYSLESDWGADVINIGYGAEIHISSKRATEVDLEKICMSLLACYPTIKGTLKKAPLRSLGFMLSNPLKYSRSVKKLKQFNLESDNYDRKVWLLKSPEEIRKIYDLPELDAEFKP